MKFNLLDAFTAINEDTGETLYFLYDDNDGITWEQLQNEGALQSELSDEEWDINIYKLGNNYYSVTSFNAPKDNGINKLKQIKVGLAKSR